MEFNSNNRDILIYFIEVINLKRNRTMTRSDHVRDQRNFYLNSQLQIDCISVPLIHSFFHFERSSSTRQILKAN